MSSYLWKVIPQKWGSPFSLEQYICSAERYLYLSTPDGGFDLSASEREQIAVGERVYIWKGKCDASDPMYGIVAIGEIAEVPLEYTGTNQQDFFHPCRLNAPGWKEDDATSKWKTGVRITNQFWAAPRRARGFNPRQGTVRKLTSSEEAILGGIR
jgi:hypothetical protein